MSWAIELVAVVSSAAAARGRAAPAITASASGSRRGMGACYQRGSPRGSGRPGEVNHRRSWRGSENLGRDPHAAGGDARGDADAGLDGARGEAAAGERAGDAV